jgi:death-on-curing protein
VARRRIRWLSRAVVAEIHRAQLREHGGRSGVRDEALVLSALDRPRNKRAYDADCDIAGLAARYAYGLAKNHGFVDGNKRVAFMAMYVLLGVNGYDLVAPEVQVVRMMEDVASGKTSERNLAEWVRGSLVKLRAGGEVARRRLSTPVEHRDGRCRSQMR